MKFPWDKKYLTISFHVIFTIAAIYVCKLLFDALAFIIINPDVPIRAALIFVGGLLSAFQSVVIAFTLAYLLDPVVDFLQKISEKVISRIRCLLKNKRPERLAARSTWIKKSKERVGSLKTGIFGKQKKPSSCYEKRTSGTVLLYLGFLTLLAVPMIFVIKKINETGTEELLGGLGDTVSKMSGDFSDFLISISITFAEWGVAAHFLEIISSFYEKLSIIIKNAGDAVVSGIPSLGGFILNFLLGMIIAFYFLRDKESIKKKADLLAKSVLSERVYVHLMKTLTDVHEIFSRYIRGQFADALIVALMIWAYLSVIGVDFALIIAVISGVSNLIPYLGAFICYVLAITVAFMSGSASMALYAAVGIFVIQQIDGIVIVPRVVGKSVRLSPVAVIISLAVAGEMFGIYGMIFAVPVCAAAKLFLSRALCWLREKREKKRRCG